MCRPLKDIVAELEKKYGKWELFTLEKRSIAIHDYEECMEHLLKVMDSYVSEVKYTLEHNLSLSVIGRITQNLIIQMVHAHEIMAPYSDAVTLFLMDERYDQNYKYWKEFDDRACEIKALIEKLADSNVFCVDETAEDTYLKYYDVVKGFGDNVPPEVEQENELAIKNGGKLLECLNSVIEMMDGELNLVKTKGLWLEESSVAEFYELNYLVYAKEYWPNVERNFRPHIIKHYLKGKVSISELELLRLEKVRDFENHTETGEIWRKYSEDQFQLASQLKEQIKTDTEWKSFFQSIFELEEYDRWIEELRNPPETEEEKQKRERLLRTNSVFTLQPTNSKRKVDILLLYNYIDTRFVLETKFVYEWYALYYIFKRNGIINTCTTEDFAKQMNDKEWFAQVDKKCKANEINAYRFLDTKAPDFWEKAVAPHGNRASTKALKNIFRRYYLLNDSLDEIYEK